MQLWFSGFAAACFPVIPPFAVQNIPFLGARPWRFDGRSLWENKIALRSCEKSQFDQKTLRRHKRDGILNLNTLNVEVVAFFFEGVVVVKVEQNGLMIIVLKIQSTSYYHTYFVSLLNAKEHCGAWPPLSLPSRRGCHGQKGGVASVWNMI